METDDSAGLPSEHVEKIRNIISFLQEMHDPEEVRDIPSWRAHQLTGKRKGAWSLTISRNWRITYEVDSGEKEITGLNFEDYH